MFSKAECFLPENIGKYVKNIQLTPIWSPSENFFIAKIEQKEGYEFCQYSVQDKQLRPLFDHELFAEQISSNQETTVDPKQLPIDKLEYISEQHVRIHVGCNSWDFDIKNNTFELASEKIGSDAMDHCPSIAEIWGLVPVSLKAGLNSPDQQWKLYCRDDNLFLKSINEQQEYQITFGGRVNSSYAKSPDTNLMSVTLQIAKIAMPPIAIWSPDSKKIITFQCDQISVEDLTLLQYVPKDETFRPKPFIAKVPFVGDKHLPEINLCLIDVVTKQLVKIDDKPLRPALVGSPFEAGYIWWNKNSDKVFFLREERGDHSISLCELDIFSKQVRTVFTEVSDAYVEPSQLLLWQNYTYVLEKQKTVVWLSQKSGWPHLYLYDLQSGNELYPLTRGEWSIRKVLYINEDEQWIYFLASGREANIDPYYRLLYRVKFDGSAIELLTKETADHTIYFSPSRKYFFDSYSTLNVPPKTNLYQANGQKLAEIIEANFSKLYAQGYEHPEDFCLKGADGETDIYGVIYRPSNFDPTKRYPIIDDIYPGPQLTKTPKTYCYDPPEYFHGPWWSQAIAELGFIVVNIDGRGTPLRSREFHLYSYEHLETAGGLNDHVTIIQKLAERLPYIDLNRVGIVGHSAGGYAASRAILTYPEFYKVAVAVSGIQDLRTYLAFWGEKYHGLVTENNYSEQSNYHLAKNLKGKLLLIHGDMDDNVHPANTMQLVNALISADKEFDMMLVPNGNHSIYFTNNYVKRKIWQFFVEHLQ